ncbi:conserved hypothetical protein [Neospora caninum Liverpool]|uniref:Uncharacterized protein n=1 Tax=Neospora caninum (strain Liverpool) TaxID=572307 RepID=F0VRB5_NEOCL|nr:conserved hypothetical protein [Neospora caninum Liverpool]CBZ56263.1 conserved hypothetical protein [Neospora caninum Liverpool]CEL71025.1 TPA: hypothetical protein BN1204_066880 [Neospora caninum Liverpool]|eukprot:XP_003886288.1 conserved hypothetical protein [Neospora caninum Liverpool]
MPVTAGCTSHHCVLCFQLGRMLRWRRILLHHFLLYLGSLFYLRTLLCSTQYPFDDLEYYPTVKPFEAGKFQNFIPYVSSPLVGSSQKSNQLDFAKTPPYSGTFSSANHEVVGVLQARWNRTEISANLTTKTSSVKPDGGVTVQYWLPGNPFGSSPSQDVRDKESETRFVSSDTGEATTVGSRLRQNGRSVSSSEDRSNVIHGAPSSSTTASAWGKIKAQFLPDQYDMPVDQGNDPLVHLRKNGTATREAHRGSYFPLAEHISKTNDLVRLYGPDSPELQETAQSVLQVLRQTGNDTDIYNAVSTLPPDIIIKLVMNSTDAYSLVRCRKGYQAVSTSLCASPLGEEVPIQGSCVGAGSYDTDMGRCFTVSEIEPISTCPIGYRIARTPLDYRYGPCRPIERLPALPSCDPPYVLDPPMAKCLYNSTHPGYIGCPPGAKTLNETTCAVSTQVVRIPQCPPGYKSTLLKDGSGECSKTLKFRGEYLATPRCKGGAKELVNYDLYDEENHPLVTCIATEVIKTFAACPPETIPYEDYLEAGNDPPVIFDSSLGHPARTCVRTEEGIIRPSCHDMLGQVPFILLGRGETEPFDYSLMMPNSLVEEVIRPDWTKLSRRIGGNGNVYYERENLEISIHCLSFHYAQPVLRCPEGTVQNGLKLEECKRKAFVDFVLMCPPGYTLNEAGLVFGPYNAPKPKCIGKLRAATQYYCPEVCVGTNSTRCGKEVANSLTT